MRYSALLFLAFSWDQSVVSNHCKLASAQECFMGLYMFRWNMLLCALPRLCVCVSVCWGRRRGTGHSQRANCHFPNTMGILNAGSYVHMAVDIALSLSLTLKIADSWNRRPPSSLCCHSCCTCLLHILSLTAANNSAPNNLCCNRKTAIVWGIVLLGKKKKWKIWKSERLVLNQTTVLRDRLVNGACCQTLFHLPSELSALMTTSTWKLFT